LLVAVGVGCFDEDVAGTVTVVEVSGSCVTSGGAAPAPASASTCRKRTSAVWSTLSMTSRLPPGTLMRMRSLPSTRTSALLTPLALTRWRKISTEREIWSGVSFARLVSSTFGVEILRTLRRNSTGYLLGTMTSSSSMPEIQVSRPRDRRGRPDSIGGCNTGWLQRA